MKAKAQLLESIQRFQDVFWDRKSTGRPPVGIYEESIFLPIQFLRQPFTRPMVMPNDVSGDLVATEYEHSFAKRAISCDDFMPFAAPWRGIPWLEAACGCPVRYSQGSLAPEHIVKSVEDLAQIPIPASHAWLNCLRRETERLVAQAPADCWISPSILRGPSDALAALRSMTGFFMDIHDDPNAVALATRRVNQVLLAELDIHYSLTPAKMGGYVQIMGYWAPGKTAMLQEDVLGMCSPLVYRDLFMESNAEIVRHLGSHVLFHFHSTGFKHYKHVMDVPGLAGVEMTMETIGPTLQDMVPVFREILEKTRLMLQVCTGFECLPGVLRKIPREGLYLVIPEKCIPADQAFREFIRANYPA